MKKVNKAKVIFRAFTSQSSIDPEILKERRSKCEGCPRNSKNFPKEQMSLKQSIQNSLGKPFCTICSCFIEEKTSQETEECALAEIGQQPLWNRIRLETAGASDINLINKSPEKVNVDLNETTGEYTIRYNPMKKDADTNIRFALEKGDKVITIGELYVNCSCMTMENEKGTSNIFFNISLDLRPYGDIQNKYVLVHYTMDGKKDFIKINIKGIVLE